MGGNVLAIKLGERQELANGIVSTGYKCMLAVQTVLKEVQFTTFYGQSLFQMTYSPWGQGQVDVGALSNAQLFTQFLREFYNRRTFWGQLVEPPYDPSYYLSRSYTLIPPQLQPPVAEGAMTLVDSGYLATKGWFLKFQGNFGLAIPVFRDWRAVVDATPDYRARIG